MIVSAACLIFVVSVILLFVASLIHMPASGNSKGAGQTTLAWGVTLLVVAAVLMFIGILRG